MSQNIGGYKKDIYRNDEKGINEIKKAREQLSNALENYFGNEVTVDDIIHLSHQKIRIKNHTKNSGKDIADTLSPGEITFGGHGIFGYTSAITLGNKIIAIKGSDVDTLSLGQEIIIKGNSAGYVPSEHKDGEIVTIIGFSMPYSKEEGSDDNAFIKVYGDNREGSIKPSNINIEDTNYYNSKIKIK